MTNILNRLEETVIEFLFYIPCPTGLNEITAPLGQTVRLTCRGQDDVIGLILTRLDLDPPYVFVFRDNRPDLTRQNQLFRDRVTLPGPLATDDDGNVVLYLSNVTWSDNGTYICQALKGPVETSFHVRVVESGEFGLFSYNVLLPFTIQYL